ATAGTVVNVNQYPVLNSDPFKVITNGDSVLIAASKGVSYIWSTGAVTDSIFAKPTVTTTYIVTITGNGGCSVTDQTIVYVDNIPVLQITGLDTAYCKYHSNVNIVSIPSGGALTGTGVTGNTLSVVNAGVGTHTISYAYDTTYQNIVTVFADNFSAEKGWTGYGAGGWERGPAKSGNPCSGSTDPASDHTQNGDNYIIGTRIGNCYDNNLMSTYYLTSPVINCSKVKNVSFDFWRNAGVESSISDKLTIQVYDGTSWVTVYSNPTGNMNDKNWTKVKYNVSQYADGISNFMIRFGVGPTDNLNQFKGWNIDDIEVTGMIEHTCSNQITKSYKVFDVPAASAGAGKTICFGSQATLIAKGGTSYHWNTGVAKDSLIVNPAKSTNYTVTVTDKNGCTASSTALVNVNVLPVVSAGGDKSICPKDSAILTASGASTYSWNTSVTTTSVKVSPAVKSTYTVTGTDANGCTGTGFAIVNLYTSPVAEAGKNINICIGGKTNLNATGGKFYKWSPATSLNADYISNPTANPAVTTTYKLTVSDIHSCTAVDSLIVYVNPLPNANAGKDTSMCIGNKIMLKATGGKTYIWSNGIKADTTIVSPAKSTTYSVTVTDTLGCVSNSTVKVTVNNLPNASGGANTMICTGDSATLNGSGGVKYVWNFGPATQSVKVSPVKNTTYYLTVTDINGCNSTAKVSVGVNSLPVVKVSGDTTVCAGGAVSLNANGALTYKWSNGASGASINAVTNTNTTYVVTGYDKNNCQSKDSIFVSTFTVNNPKITVTGGGLVYCEGNNISLTLTVPAKYYSYLWSSGSTTSSITVKSGGRYYARVSDKSGKCLAYSDTIVVHVKPLPVADFGRSDSALKISFFNRSQNYTSSKWYFGDGAVDSIMNPVHVYGAYGYYTVKLVAYNSCGVDSVSQSLYLRDVGIEDNEATLNNIKLYPIPTSDNVTLQFTTSKVDNMEVTIFDQLGAEIYKEQIGSFQGQFTKTYNLNKFAKGVYLFQIRSDKGIVNRRAIVE
ncbi:MAG: PKD domain-containing protein, partial [Bacteroidota bacterium]|nr:PKD domain-containing protein [Bacteroidota bacterium]